MTKGDLVSYTDLQEHELDAFREFVAAMSFFAGIWPVCMSWPMGFSWSSFIAQSKLLKCCRAAGLDEARMLADDLPVPAQTDVSFALATDDVMVFSLGDESAAAPWLEALDEAIAASEIVRHPDKDVNAKTNETAIGVDLVDGRFFAPHGKKLAKVLRGCIHFLSHGEASRLEVSALIGHLSWFALMVRALFSCFASIYGFGATRTGPGQPVDPDSRDAEQGTPPEQPACGDTERSVVPRSARVEIMLFLGLTALIENDLTREWQDHLVACDASSVFGFGVSVASSSSDLVRTIGRDGAKRDIFARLERDGLDPDEEEERPRKGASLRIPLSKAAFSTVVSARNKHEGHSGALEAHGVTLALRWVLRSPKRHSRRTTLLIDAQAVLGAVVKGRSSAPTLAREIRKIGAHVLAGDLLIKAVYIPSEENPADALSRGVVRRWKQRTGAPVKSPHLKGKPTADGNWLAAVRGSFLRASLTRRAAAPQ